MIGLEYLINIYGLKNKNVSDSLDISPVTVHDWIKGNRKIPAARIEQLSQIFKGIPKKFFQKELTELDKLKIQNAKVHREICEMDEDNEELPKQEKFQFDVEMKIMKLKLSETINYISDNLKSIANRDFIERENMTYGLKAFFDIYNSKESYLVGFMLLASTNPVFLADNNTIFRF